jgi:two-component system, NtrC family, response regulator HydG
MSDKIDGKILIIDDDQAVLYTAKMILKQRFEAVATESSPAEVIPQLQKNHFDVILLDMNFAHGMTSGQEGIRLLREIMKVDPEAHVIVNTAYGDIYLAVEAMKEGAADFLVKPWEKEKLLSTVLSIFKLSQSRKELVRLKHKESALRQDLDSPYAEIISASAPMQKIFTTIKKVAATDASVLILGENGTGKELIARAIHRQSKRAHEAFIKVDLGAISESLFEAELFGHVKGAFTDAKEDRAGRFEVASGGTLFLDEIGNLSLPLQAKLLTALQSHEIIRIGANQPFPVDVRLICATNLPLHDLLIEPEGMPAINTGRRYFRQDLFYRINTVEIKLPPLRERKEDIPVLIEHYLDLYKKKYQKPELRINQSTLEKLQHYRWAGNVRELQHATERAVILCASKKLKSTDFLPDMGSSAKEEKSAISIQEVEKEAIDKAIRKHNGNLSQAAQELGLGRSTLYRKMKKYGL